MVVLLQCVCLELLLLQYGVVVIVRVRCGGIVVSVVKCCCCGERMMSEEDEKVGKSGQD